MLSRKSVQSLNFIQCGVFFQDSIFLSRAAGQPGSPPRILKFSESSTNELSTNDTIIRIITVEKRKVLIGIGERKFYVFDGDLQIKSSEKVEKISIK